MLSETLVKKLKRNKNIFSLQIERRVHWRSQLVWFFQAVPFVFIPNAKKNISGSDETNEKNTVDGRNPANQFRLVVYPIIYKVFATSQVVVWDFFHQQ